MADRLPGSRHFQLRLVKRIDAGQIVTHGPVGVVNSLDAPDNTMDFGGTEKGVLQHARNYCRRGAARKGPLPGPFLGVVVVEHESDSSILELANIRNMPRGTHIKGRAHSLKGTTKWLFYIKSTGEAFYLNRTHHIGAKVLTEREA